MRSSTRRGPRGALLAVLLAVAAGLASCGGGSGSGHDGRGWDQGSWDDVSWQ